MSPNCTRTLRVWKARSELFEILKERRGVLYLLHPAQTPLAVLTATPSSRQALGGWNDGMHRVSQNSSCCRGSLATLSCPAALLL